MKEYRITSKLVVSIFQGVSSFVLYRLQVKRTLFKRTWWSTIDESRNLDFLEELKTKLETVNP